MLFSHYQKESRKTAIYPNIGDNITYPALGLAGESGEVCEKIKKIIRDKKGIYTTEDQVQITKELGDVLWYLSQIATEFNLNLDLIAAINLEKLQKRQQENKLHGSGDDR